MDLKGFLTGDVPLVEGRGLAGITITPPRKPLIAAVEGYALAGGCEVALACDLIVAARDARFGLPETKRALVAGGGGLLRLPQRIPPGIAMEYALTGDPFDAEEAARWGLVNRLTEPGDALAAARDLAARIAANGPLAVRATKEIITHGRAWPADEWWSRQQELLNPVFASRGCTGGRARIRGEAAARVARGVSGMSTQPSVVVTGAAGALGRAVVEEFRRDGWLVIGVDRPGEPLEELAAHPGVSVVAGELADRDAVVAAWQQVDAIAVPSALVALAGAFRPSSLADLTPQVWDEMWQSNVASLLWCCQQAAPRLAAAGGGAIVTVGSKTAVGGSAPVAHATSKAAVVRMTRAAGRRTAAPGHPGQRGAALGHRHARQPHVDVPGPRRPRSLPSSDRARDPVPGRSRRDADQRSAGAGVRGRLTAVRRPPPTRLTSVPSRRRLRILAAEER